MYLQASGPQRSSAPRPAQTASPVENSPEAKAQRSSLTVPSRLPGAPETSAPLLRTTLPPPRLSVSQLNYRSGSGKSSGRGGTKRQARQYRVLLSLSKQRLSRQLRMQGKRNTPCKAWACGFYGTWDPRVLKVVEDSLAEHIGPVAKILVGRAARHTKDLHELCQALAAQLSTEQERKSFLHNVLRRSKHIPTPLGDRALPLPRS